MIGDEKDGPEIDIEALLESMRPPELPSDIYNQAPKIVGWLAKLDKKHALETLAGLQIRPEFHANTVRLNWATRLVASYASGSQKLKRDKLVALLNIQLKKAGINRLEDPIEDFFVAPIVTRGGEFVAFQSSWYNATFHTEVLLEAFAELPEGQPKNDALTSVKALLRLVDAIVKRAGLERWETGSGQPAIAMKLPSQSQINASAHNVRLRWAEVESIVSETSLLSPFVLSIEEATSIADQPIGNALIDFKPLLADQHGITLVAPGAITTAARAHLIHEATTGGMGRLFQYNLLQEEAHRLRVAGFENFGGGPIGHCGNESVRQKITEISEGHFVHFMQTMDGFESWAEDGFSGARGYTDEFYEALFDGARFALDTVQKKSNFRSGTTVLLMGGWGQGRALEFEVPADLRAWQFKLVEPAEAVTLGPLEDSAMSDLKRVWTIERMARVMGFELHNPSGFLNLFQWWRESDYVLVPEHQLEAVPPCQILFGSDCLFEARKESARATDRRALPYVDGRIRRVMRAETQSMFGSLEPIYACIDAVRDDELLGVVLYSGMPVWISCKIIKANFGDQYENWRAVLFWANLFDKLNLETPPIEAQQPVVVSIQVDWPNLNKVADTITDDALYDAVTYQILGDGCSAELQIREEWHHGLHRENNLAEVVLAAKLLSCIAEMRGVPISLHDALIQVATIAGSKDLRWRHALSPERPIELLHAHGLIRERYRKIPRSAAALVKFGAALAVKGAKAGQTIQGKEACIEFLVEFQTSLSDSLCKAIAAYQSEALVVNALDRLQAALWEQRSWETSARALRAIHGVDGDEQASLEVRSQINGTIRACSILAEMAASHAAIQSEYQVGSIDLDDLQAMALQLFVVSDLIPAMHADQVSPELQIGPTGHLLHDHEFGDAALGSPIRLLHSKNRSDQSAAYSRLHEPVADSDPKGLDERLLQALAAEYGVVAEVFMQFSSVLTEMAIEKKQSPFVLRRSDLIRQLDDLKLDGSPAFGPLIDRLTLACRDSWNDISTGSSKSDFDISRFDRRFSLIGRPLVAIDNEGDPLLVVSPAVVARSAIHNLSGATDGGLQGGFWVSDEMLSYTGHAGEKSGMKFNEQVALAVRSHGLRADASVKPSDCLNLKATDELKRLGDIDVLAFSSDKKHAWVIEVKDIKLCRTQSEAARRLSAYRGIIRPNGRPDNLLRHLNRVEFVRKHAANLAKRNKMPCEPEVHGLVIVDAPQPMSFVISSNSKDARFVRVDALDEVEWAPNF